MYLRQSTASQEIALGPFVDETDGKTAETALTIANTDIKLHKAGGTTLTNKASGGATHISGGIYYAVLDATDTDTLGNLRVFVHVAGALPVVVQAVILTANVYDSLVAGSDLLDANVSQFGGTNGTFASGRPEVNTTHAAGTAWGSGAITAASIAADAITAAKIATGAIDADAIADGAIDAGAFAADAITAAKIASDVTTEIAAPILAVLGALNDAAADGAVTTTDTMVAYLKQIINTLEGAPGIPTYPAAAAPGNAVSIAEGVRGIYERLGAPAGASTAADIAAVKVDTAAILVDTAEIGAAGAGLTEAGGTGDQFTAIPWNASWDAQVQSEVEDGLDVQLADSVPADGTRPTMRQALYMLYQYMTERDVAGTTVTINKVDGTTALFTLALDDGTTPTSISRAT